MIDPVDSLGTSGPSPGLQRVAKANGPWGNSAGAPPLQLWNMGEDHVLPPPRDWLMKGTFCKGFLSGIAAAGGVGKTALRIVQLLAVATGRVDFTGDHIFGRFRVLFISLEDDLAEIRRRIWAATLHHGIPHDERLDCFWLTNPSELKLARISSTNPRRIEPGELDAELRLVILDRRIDIVAIDPFLKAHEADENDNGLIDQVCVLLVRIAIECGCAVDIVHHTAKGFTKPGDANRMRGASALRDAVRLFYTLTPMSEKEANGFGVSEAERRSLMRLDSAKLNLCHRRHKPNGFVLSMLSSAIAPTSIQVVIGCKPVSFGTRLIAAPASLQTPSSVSLTSSKPVPLLAGGTAGPQTPPKSARAGGCYRRIAQT
jgi:hypothetical protein